MTPLKIKGDIYWQSDPSLDYHLYDAIPEAGQLYYVLLWGDIPVPGEREWVEYLPANWQYNGVGSIDDLQAFRACEIEVIAIENKKNDRTWVQCRVLQSLTLQDVFHVMPEEDLSDDWTEFYTLSKVPFEVRVFGDIRYMVGSLQGDVYQYFIILEEKEELYVVYVDESATLYEYMSIGRWKIGAALKELILNAKPE